MKYAAPFLALLFLVPVLSAQEDSTTALVRENSSLQQELILQNTREILRRLEKAPAVQAETPVSDSTVENLSGRLAELEKKLAAGSLTEAVTAGPAPEAATKAGTNAIWIITAGALVFFMQAGFCMLELGLTRPKNAINICMKNVLDFCTGAICFLFVGFGLMFGASQGGWFGAGPFWLSGIGGSEPFWEFWLFQVVFSGTAATIISGAMAERTRFVGYLCFTVIMTSLIYPVIGHWAWGSLGGGFGYGGEKGWLEALGYVDFAGSSVVHGIGGAAALAGVLVLGPRLGRFREDGSPNLIPGHNLPLAALGTFILWFGWYGFNAGSTLTADVSIGRIAVNTTMAPSAGALAAMLTVWIFQGRPDLSLTLNGALGGLVGITANCHCVTPAAAVLIGLVAGLLATLASIMLERLRVDDAVGAVPVHLVCGWWGILAVAFFHEEGFTPARLGVQALGIATMTGTAFVVAGVAFLLIDRLIGLRATPEEQDLGLDFTEHSGTAYAGFVTSEKANV